MYWINIKALKNDLRSGSYRERDIVPYIIADGILTELFSIGGSDSSLGLDIAFAAVGIMALVFGTWHVFGQHNSSSQASFLAKYISLGWVVGVRLALTIIPVAIVAVLLFSGIGNAPIFYAGLVLLMVVYCAIYYLLLGKHISET